MTVVDVQDMLCAQALAVVGRAMRQVEPGETLGVRYATEDVRRDLLTWATAQDYTAQEQGERILHIERRG